MSETPFTDSQKLVRCDVINRYNEASVRMVEIDAFKLWQFLMTNKHSLQISNPVLCLWVCQGEFDDNSAIFERAGEAEAVSRIVVDLFDKEYGFSQTSVRYARNSEAEQVVTILKSHIPEDIRETDDCSVQIIPGQIMQQWHHPTDNPMILGLQTV